MVVLPGGGGFGLLLCADPRSHPCRHRELLSVARSLFWVHLSVDKKISISREKAGRLFSWMTNLESPPECGESFDGEGLGPGAGIDGGLRERGGDGG